MAIAERDFQIAVGHVMRGYRGELGWSQDAMGNLLELNQRTVSDIEKGQRMLSAVEVVVFPKRLATVLPYTEDEIRRKLLDSPHLRLVRDEPAVDSTASDSGSSSIPGSPNRRVEREAA